MTDSFKYQKFPSGKPEAAFRPMIKVSFAINNQPIQPAFDALIDSGSDKTISYEMFAYFLGIAFSNKKLKENVDSLGWEFNSEIEGLGPEPIKVYKTPVDMIINGKIIKNVQMHWLRLPFKAATDFPVMLGQDTIFEAFDIHFSKRQFKFFLNEDKFNPEGKG